MSPTSYQLLYPAIYGAGDRDRTGTGFLPRDFKSLASANSATPARVRVFRGALVSQQDLSYHNGSPVSTTIFTFSKNFFQLSGRLSAHIPRRVGYTEMNRLGTVHSTLTRETGGFSHGRQKRTHCFPAAPLRTSAGAPARTPSGGSGRPDLPRTGLAHQRPLRTLPAHARMAAGFYTAFSPGEPILTIFSALPLHNLCAPLFTFSPDSYIMMCAFLWTHFLQTIFLWVPGTTPGYF